MERFESLVRKCSDVLGLIGNITLVLMMLLMVADIFLRYAFNSPIMGSFEIVEFMMVVVVFFGFAATQMEDGHVRVTMLVNRFPPRLRHAVDSITLLVGAAMLGMITYAALLQAAKSRAEGAISAVLFLPVYPFIYLLALGSLLYTLTLLAGFLAALGKAVSGNNN